MGFCCGVETKSELGYWGLPVQIKGCGGLVPQLDHKLRIDGWRRHLQQIEDDVSAAAGGFKEGGFVGEYDQLWLGLTKKRGNQSLLWYQVDAGQQVENGINEKNDRNRTNPGNHHLESACKTLGIITYEVFGITTKQRIEINSNKKLLFIIFNDCLTILVEPLFNRFNHKK